MKIEELPQFEKPREKAIHFGIDKLSNAELLAIVLRSGYKGVSAIDLAYILLSKYDGLEGLKNLNFVDLKSTLGLKDAKALSLLATIEIAKRISYQSKEYRYFKNPSDVYNILEPLLSSEEQEKCYVILLNNKNYIIQIEEVAKGSNDFHLVHPRDIFRIALKFNSNHYILVHNHPSGDSSPSKEDIDTTKEIILKGQELGIKLVEHVIIGKGNYCALKTNKFI